MSIRRINWFRSHSRTLGFSIVILILYAGSAFIVFDRPLRVDYYLFTISVAHLLLWSSAYFVWVFWVRNLISTSSEINKKNTSIVIADCSGTVFTISISIRSGLKALQGLSHFRLLNRGIPDNHGMKQLSFSFDRRRVLMIDGFWFWLNLSFKHILFLSLV